MRRTIGPDAGAVGRALDPAAIAEVAAESWARGSRRRRAARPRCSRCWFSRLRMAGSSFFATLREAGARHPS